MNNYQNKSKALTVMALVLSGLVAGCDSGGGGGGGNGPSAASATGQVCSGTAGACVSLGSAGNLGAASGYGILAQTGISTVPGSVVTGNVGLSPNARVGLTGWSETSDVTDTYSTSTQVVAPS